MRMWCAGLVVAALVMFASGCNKGGSQPTRGGPGATHNANNGGNNNNADTFALKPSNVTVTQGQSAELKININRNKYEGAVRLDITPKINGVMIGTAGEPLEIQANQDSVTIPVTATPSANVGEHAMSLKGEGSTGGAPAQSGFTLTVKAGKGAGSPAQGASLDIEAGNITIAAGDTANYPVGIKRAAGSTEPVKVSFEKLPKGVTITPQTQTASAEQASVTFKVSVAKNAATGTTNAVVVATPENGRGEQKQIEFKINAPGK